MPKRQHSELESENGGRSSAEDRTSKRSKDNCASPCKDKCKGIIDAHSKEILEILESVKDGRVSIGEGPPEPLTKLLRKMLSELDNSGDEMTSVLSTKALEDEANADPPAAKIYDNEIRPLLPLTEWTLSDIPKSFPPLPPILDPTQEKMALTHHGKRDKDWQLSYENLEFLGDAFIYHVASEIISQTFPILSPGRCSQIRERLLRNSNLSQYSLHYGLGERARLPDEFKKGGRSGGSRASLEQRQKVHADLFEAYVGALIRSDPQGVQRAQQWLKSLWALTIEKDIRNEYLRRKEIQQVSKTSPGSTATDNGRGEALKQVPKVQLIDLIGCNATKIRYEDSPGRPKKAEHSRLRLFAIDVWVDGWGRSECLGHGSALSKKDAGSKAAQLALFNKKALKFFVEKKRAYLAAREEQAARAAPDM